MDIGLLHSMCKQDCRIAFNNIKDTIHLGLFPFNDALKSDLQNQLLEGLCSKTVKHFVMSYNLSDTQIHLLRDTIIYYKQIVLSSFNNYSKRFL